MKVLVIGQGGREHALVWKMAQSTRVEKIYCAPGNAGIAEFAECVPISENDFNALISFAKKENIDLTIVGPEIPLVNGIVDEFQKNNLKIFGPSKKAALIEGSKVFTKEFCIKNNIPTGKAEVFTDINQAKIFLDEMSFPLVIKADGLAAGKGVYICNSKSEAISSLEEIMNKRIFGNAGDKVIVEEYLQGEEASFLAISDGYNILPLASSQDHKAIFENDKGPNTGGMGAYSPAPVITEDLNREIMQTIMIPTIKALRDENRIFNGVLYAGLMIKNNKPYVLEFNCRFGDPETEPILMRLKSDIVDVFEASIKGTLNELSLEWDNGVSVCVILASKGYPGVYKKGYKINGLDELQMENNLQVFHSGTKKDNGSYLTNAGRVLGVTSIEKNIKDAIDKVYKAIELISWEGMYFRKDIGKKALKR